MELRDENQQPNVENEYTNIPKPKQLPPLAHKQLNSTSQSSPKVSPEKASEDEVEDTLPPAENEAQQDKQKSSCLGFLQFWKKNRNNQPEKKSYQVLKSRPDRRAEGGQKSAKESAKEKDMQMQIQKQNAAEQEQKLIQKKSEEEKRQRKRQQQRKATREAEKLSRKKKKGVHGLEW
jgi:hypothetical protein